MFYDELIYIRYDENENSFYTVEDVRILNIHQYLTSNDLYLFREDHGFNIFNHRFNKLCLCEIFMEE